MKPAVEELSSAALRRKVKVVKIGALIGSLILPFLFLYCFIYAYPVDPFIAILVLLVYIQHYFTLIYIQWSYLKQLLYMKEHYA